jgi:hypothetical protein
LELTEELVTELETKHPKLYQLYREEMELCRIMLRATIRGLELDPERRDAQTYTYKDKKGALKTAKGLRVKLTEKIYMNLRAILEKSDESVRKAIWQHLFNIMYLFNPEDDVIRTELKASLAEQDTKENKFLMDTFSKFEKVMAENKDMQNPSDPMAMVSNLMQSGFLNDMIGGINNGVSSGSLDIKSLIGTVQNLLGNLSETIDREDRAKK